MLGRLRTPVPMTHSNQPDLSIAIVNTNTCELLRACLQSIRDTQGDLNVQTVVVDNNSWDDSVQMMKAEFPEVHLIENDYNAGFPKATNQGLAASTGRYLLLLNPDTIVKPNCFQLMMEFLEKNPDVGAVGPRIRYPTGKLQYSARTFPNLLTGAFNSKSILTRLFPNNPWSRAYTARDEDYERTRDVDWLVGACIMVPRRVYEEVGGLDEIYFLYSDDVDWCLEMKKRGWRRVYYHEPEIVHYEEQTIRTMPVLTITHRHKSMWLYYRKHYPRAWWRAPLHAAVYAGIWSRCGLSLARTYVVLRWGKGYVERPQ